MRMSTAGRLLSAAFVTAAFIGTGSGAGADLAGRPIWQYHASMMILAFLCLLSAAYLAVFRPRRYWLRWHRMMGLSGAGLALLGAVVAGYMVSASSGKHMAYPHSWIGLLVAAMLVLTPSLGLAQFHFRHWASRIRPIHRWSGRLTIVLMALNMLAGLRLIGLL
ncbi:MAG: Eukaryotic cytochrome b561 [Methanosaeta sp. PtaB.Bin039]|nr:MAG: Eukaryotic cytochrome b561 [Methanosaeta sp. PtaB.Bin039]